MNQNKKQSGSAKVKELRLLSLDGGGVRGLSSLLILKRLMEGLDPKNPPKPCEYFQLIGGTSTGGLIALMLGRMRMTVDQCIAAYESLAAKIFTRVRHRVKLSNGATQGRFDHKALEAGIREILQEHGFEPDCLFKEPGEDECKTFVCATSREISQTVIMSSYWSDLRGGDMLNTVKLWEAARATSAATTFFEPIEISHETFIDGATGANNPINEVWTEASTIWKDKESKDERSIPFDDHIQCLISIGTGVPGLSAFGPSLRGVAESLKKISTDTEKTAADFMRNHLRLLSSKSYFRFNVEHGLEDIGLEAHSKWGHIKAATRNYIQSPETQTKIQTCISRMKEAWFYQINTLISVIEQAVKQDAAVINALHSLKSPSDQPWLSHTVGYHQWCKGGKKALVYLRDRSLGYPSRDTVAASLACHLSDRYSSSLGGSGGMHNHLPRAIYVDCQVNEQCDSQNVLWSLILQLIMMDCQTQEALRERLLTVDGYYRTKLRSKLKESPLPLAEMWGLFRHFRHLVAPNVVAIENAHLIMEWDSDCEESAERTFFPALFDILEGCSSERTILTVLSSDCQARHAFFDICIWIDDNTEIQECLHSFYFPEWSARRDQVTDACPGTNTWIHNHRDYQSWTLVEGSWLWIEGKPGSGKSVLAKSLRNFYRRQEIPKTQMVVDWFFHSRGGNVGVVHSTFFRSIIYQLLRENPRLFEIALPRYRNQEPSSGAEWPLDDMVSIFESFCNSGISTICIIDAMDEAQCVDYPTLQHSDSRRDRSILYLISRLFSSIPESKVRFIILSRPKPTIEMDFRKLRRKFPVYKVTLENENEQDIGLLIDQGLLSLSRQLHKEDSTSESDGEPLSEITRRRKYQGLKGPANARSLKSKEDFSLQNMRSYMKQTANGVVLWVALVLKEVENHASHGIATFAELETIMRSLPLELDSFYEYMIKGIEARHGINGLTKSRTAFLLISTSSIRGRQIELRELREGLAIQAASEADLSGKTDPIEHNMIPVESWSSFRRKLHKFCGFLVEVIPARDRENVVNCGDGPDNTVQFIHRTVMDFFHDESRQGPLHFSRETATWEVTELCRKYLAIAFPPTTKPYGPPIPAWRGSLWWENISEYVDYIDSRSFLAFAEDMISSGPAQSPISLGVYGSLDKLLYLPPGDASVLDIDPTLSFAKHIIGDVTELYPHLQARSAGGKQAAQMTILGETFRYACKSGKLTAVRTMLKICRKNGGLSKMTLQGSAILSGVLLASIELGFLDQVDFLGYPQDLGSFSYRSTPLLDFIDKRPFIQLAAQKNQHEVVELVLSRSAWPRMNRQSNQSMSIQAEYRSTTSETSSRKADYSIKDCQTGKLVSARAIPWHNIETKLSDRRTREKTYDLHSNEKLDLQLAKSTINLVISSSLQSAADTSAYDLEFLKEVLEEIALAEGTESRASCPPSSEIPLELRYMGL